MNKPLLVLLACALSVTGVGLQAQAPPGTGPSMGTAGTGATASAVPAATALRMRGTIDKYDGSARILSLATGNGIVPFQLVAATRIRQHWQDVDPSQLAALAGSRATVRYTESRGDKTAESVHVFGKSERTDR